MFNKKAQMDIKELIITIVVAGILFIVGLLIFANISNSTQSILDPTANSQINESIAIVQQGGNDNSTLLVQSRVITPSADAVRNRTNQSEIIVKDVDYSITLIGGSGKVGTRANFTWIDVAGYNFSNTTGVFITYSYNSQSAAQASTQTIQSTVLDSFELGVIALIVLAAVVILAVLFRLGQ